jgi:hypothetical protein
MMSDKGLLFSEAFFFARVVRPDGGDWLVKGCPASIPAD